MLPLLNDERTLIVKILLENKNEIILICVHLAPQPYKNKVELARLETILT